MENKYNLALIQPTPNMIYPKTEAHAELKAMMNRNERINISFGIDKEGYEILYAESKTTAWFKYRLNAESFAWIMRYLANGETEDFNVKPMELTKSEYENLNCTPKVGQKTFGVQFRYWHCLFNLITRWLN